MIPSVKSLLISFLLATIAAAPVAQKGVAPSPHSAQEDDIREAVFRYQFTHVELIFAYHFIAIDGKNPSEAFLQRFREDDPPVRPISEAERVKKPMRMVVSRNDQKQGVIFYLGPIKWISDTKVDVEGRFECGDTCDEYSGVYHVTKQNNNWVVESFDSAGKAGS
jgi:hypothetical protein